MPLAKKVFVKNTQTAVAMWVPVSISMYVLSKNLTQQSFLEINQTFSKRLVSLEKLFDNYDQKNRIGRRRKFQTTLVFGFLTHAVPPSENIPKNDSFTEIFLKILHYTLNMTAHFPQIYYAKKYNV